MIRRFKFASPSTTDPPIRRHTLRGAALVIAAMGAIILNGANALAAGDYRLYKVTPLVLIQPVGAPTIETSSKMGTAGINSDGQVVYTRQRTRNCPAFTTDDEDPFHETRIHRKRSADQHALPRRCHALLQQAPMARGGR